MICRVDGTVLRGDAVSLPEPVDARSVATAVCRGVSHWEEGHIEVIAAPASPLHEHVGCIHPETGIRIRTALASAARTRGHTSPYDEEIVSLREQLREITAKDGSASEYRRTLAETTAERDQLREEVATARGRLQANGSETTQTEREKAIRRLSEAETAAAATREQLERAREKRRQRRDTRERQFRLEDRIENRRRQARAYLRDQVRDAYTTAVQQVPGSDCPEPFEADPVTAALALVRVADLDAPVVLACDRFESPRAARRWLDAPVLKV